jgi:Ser-tRNA(Ala) deacylase AlaX
VVRTGTGRLVNISRSGLLFECAHGIPPRTKIELEVDWPAQAVKMALHVTGQTVRNQGVSTAMTILRSSFRTYQEDADQGNRQQT